MRLDASSIAHSSPEAAATQQPDWQNAGSSPQVAAVPCFTPVPDLWADVEAAYEPEQPRKKRVQRKVGTRASARKRMHRATFRRGKPQRAPAL